MPGDPRMRASDADRERIVNLLREHHAEGRLDIEEFHDRLNAAYAAKTIGDLEALLADMPGIDLYRLPSAGLKAAPVGSWAPARRPSGTVARQSAQWAAWAAGTAVLGLIWVVAGIAAGGTAWIPWFLVIAVPWAIALNRRRS